MATMDTTVIGNQEATVGKSTLHVLDSTGDTKLMWDRNNEDEVDAARKMFDDLKRKQYIAYKAEGKEGKKGEVINRFDPEAERIILAPRMVGG